MVIVCIMQVYNEVDSGNLKQFFKHHFGLFDHVIVFDDGSTDGTHKYCLEKNAHVIRAESNDFKAEVFHKKRLIEVADKFNPDFIVSLDADEILSNSREDLEIICQSMANDNVDGFKVNFINLWRSNTFIRTDSLFNELKPVRIWKHCSGATPFNSLKKGLHQRLYPDYIKTVSFNENVIVIHTGFTTKDKVLDKFVRYRSLGQKGFELLRFVDETNLSLEKVNPSLLPSDWAIDNDAPSPLSIKEYFNSIEEARKRVLKPKVTIFSLIYKDIGWLSFMYRQFLKYTPVNDVEFYFVANDASSEVLNYLKNNFIPHYSFCNSKKNKSEHYINNVYRAYNYGVSKAKGDFVVMLNSDMTFSDGWLSGLTDQYRDGLCISSRLIEQGKLKTGTHGIEKNFGDSWQSYDEEEFIAYANEIKNSDLIDGGLYMPILVKKKDFEDVGGYPEGNVLNGSDIFNPVIALPEQQVISGDAVFIAKLETIGVRHVTSFASVVYHFQEGEKRSNAHNIDVDDPGLIAICNNRMGGINGEKVMWGHLLGFSNTVPLDFELVNGKSSSSFQEYVDKNNINLALVFQNASFVPYFFPHKYTVSYLQDNLRAMGRTSNSQEMILKNSQCRLTNTIDTAASYPEYDFDICPVGVDEKLFKPLDKNLVRDKYGIKQEDKVGIFVGALDDVKGWPEVRSIIEEEKELRWLIVTKYDDFYSHPNVRFFTSQPQEVLVELLNAADFFILGSPIETQCLAAIEAALCDIPVVMKPVGIFSSMADEDCLKVGGIQIDLREGINNVLGGEREFSPRETIIKYGISLAATNEVWHQLMSREKTKALSTMFFDQASESVSLSYNRRFLYRVEFFYRFKILKPMIGRDTFYSSAELSVYLKNNVPMPIFRVLRSIWRMIK